MDGSHLSFLKSVVPGLKVRPGNTRTFSDKQVRKGQGGAGQGRAGKSTCG
jgi:hypothetical protein